MNQQLVYRFDDFVVDPGTWRLVRDGQEIHLEPVVLELLIHLIAHRDRLVTQRELMDTVWGHTVISESALRQAVARLRKALGDNSDTPRYLETVHSKGYRFIAEVQETGSPDPSDAPPLRPRKPAWGRVMVTGASMAILVVLAVFWIRTAQQDTPQNEQIQSLAVLPLSNLTGDPDQAYYADGLQDILITELSQLSGLRVTSRQSTKRYRSSDLTTADIAGELGVDALVEGSVLRAGGNIEVTVQLIDGRNNEHLWAERYSSETSHIYDLISDIAHAIGSAISPARKSSLSDKPARARMDPVDPRAVDAYALGVAHLDRFTRVGIRTAIDQFETAVAIEPEFALGWSQLAAANAMEALFGYAPPRDSIEKARVASLKAIAADEQVAIGHSGLGWTRLWTGDIDGACASYEAALRLNPSDPYAIHGDADCLMLEGRLDESVARTRDLLMVGPYSAMHSLPLPVHLYLARRFDESIAAAKEMQARTPQFSVHWVLALVYWQQGQYDNALEQERLELERRGDTVRLAALEAGLDTGGPRGAMRAMADALVARANETYADPLEIGETFARAGMIDEALHWLDKAAGHGSYKMTYLAYWPHFDAVRDDPRYQDLLERIYGERAQEIGRIASAHRPQDQ
jgi:TolB-like protein/DNA-binding winged helix-turn-helix (wHTH) protein